VRPPENLRRLTAGTGRQHDKPRPRANTHCERGDERKNSRVAADPIRAGAARCEFLVYHRSAFTTRRDAFTIRRERSHDPPESLSRPAGNAFTIRRERFHDPPGTLSRPAGNALTTAGNALTTRRERFHDPPGTLARPVGNAFTTRRERFHDPSGTLSRPAGNAFTTRRDRSHDPSASLQTASRASGLGPAHRTRLGGAEATAHGAGHASSALEAEARWCREATPHGYGPPHPCSRRSSTVPRSVPLSTSCFACARWACGILCVWIARPRAFSLRAPVRVACGTP
jgi:hypothetical protein